MTAIAPKRLFISHASEDKYAFAKPMTDYLISEKGIDAWLDLYEMVGGDDVVEQIWEKGFETDHIVVLLSPDFLRKVWTMHELRTAVAKKINEGARVIPVVVRPCDIPSVLASTLLYQVGPNGTIIDIADRIADIAYGLTMKPLLGSPPGHFAAVTLTVPGLNSSDTLILEVIFDNLLKSSGINVSTREIRTIASTYGISDAMFEDSIEMLIDKGLISSHHKATASRTPLIVRVPSGSILSLAKAKGFEVDRLRCQFAGHIINDAVDDGETLERLIGCPRPILVAIITDFKSRCLIDHVSFVGGRHRVTNVSARLRRWFAEEC